ncbi:MAG: AMP-binding protein, partial [Muribaculaceae bacterium]|nr:AMP-binding protein [Muribaculaceae bacterium]
SGSTSAPKAIKLLKADMRASALSTCRFFDINSSSILVCPLSADYIAGKMMIVRALESGATLYMERPSNNPAAIRYDDIDLIAIVPSQLQGLIENSNINKFRNVIIGGAPLSQQQISHIRSTGLNAYSTYGMTETCSHVALKNISGNDVTYHALPGYTFTVDNRSCLVVNSSVQSFGSLTTNDVVNLIDDSSFEWLGRHDNVIITGGLKVHPELVEQKISNCLDRCFYIAPVADYKWGQVVALYIEGEEFDTAKLIAGLSEILRPHELPRKVLFVKSFNRTGSGKVIRR